tara:strand:- start:42206 stop:42634 length:429 start_codon:yes stop_codon:yes gene_type:complete
MLFKANTKNGKLFIKERIAFENFLRDLDGREISVMVESGKGKIRTLEQNDLYFGILRKIMKVLIDRGYDDMNVVMLNNYFKKMFLGDYVPDVITGESIEITRNTSELSTKGFSEHIDKVIRFALQEMDIKPEWLEPYLSSME